MLRADCGRQLAFGRPHLRHIWTVFPFITRRTSAALTEGEGVVKAVKSALVGVFGLLAMVGSASAARAEESVVATVPFAFVVNGVVLPAGDYVISRDTRQPDLMSITTASGSRTMLTLTRGNAAFNIRAEQPKLEFERVGAQVYLSQVTLGPGNVREIEIPAADTEAPRAIRAAVEHDQR